MAPVAATRPAHQASSVHGKGTFVLVSVLIFVFAYLISSEASVAYVMMAAAVALYIFVLYASGLSFLNIVLYILVAYLPFSKKIGEDFGHFGSAFNFTNILTGTAVVLWGIDLVRKKRSGYQIHAMDIPIFLFVILGFISIFRYASYGSNYMSEAMVDYLQRWGIPILLYFLIVHTVSEKKMIQNLVFLIMLATVVVSLMASIDYLSIGGGDLEDSRIRGVTDDPNLLAAFISYYMFFSLAFACVYWKKLFWWAMIIPFLICFRGIMVTFSRAGYLAFAAGSTAVLFFRKRILFLLIVALAWLLFQNPAYIPSGVRYRLGQTVVGEHRSVSNQSSLDPSVANRLRVWEAAGWMIKEHPFFGVGYNLFREKIPHYWSGGSMDPHNSYLLIASEMGVPALALFFCILAMMGWKAYLLYSVSGDLFSKAVGLGFLGGLAAFLVCNMFGTRLDSHEVSSYFWILAGVATNLHSMNKAVS